MGSIPPIPFNGSSTYSSSLQQVLNRAVQIAALPMQQMQNRVSDLSNQQLALTNLENTFGSLVGALQSVGAASQGNLSASVSDSSIVSASAGATALPGTYTIAVDNLGSSTTTLSKAGLTTVTDPTTGNIDSSSSFTLTVNGTATTITPTGTSLESLAGAINDAGAGVQATIVNVGPSSTPDYRLALTSTNLGADTIQLQNGSSTALLDTMQTGADAAYKVNGGVADIQSTSRQVTLAPGLTVNLLQQQSAGAAPVAITVASNYSGLQNALSNFATAYNSAVDALGQQRGQNAGPLSGQSIVYSLQDTLRSISQYSAGGGPVTSLSDLGLSLDQSGHLSFDATTFNNPSPADVQQFLGSTTSGGFLKAASDALTEVSDSTTGSIVGAINTIQNDITNENDQITEEQSRITDLQNNLQSRLAAADAAIATLQAQKTYFTNLFAAEYFNNGPNSKNA